MEKMKVFKGGIPTQLDVEKLIDRFGVPEEGTLIPYEEIKDCLQDVPYGSSRWRTVIGAWKRSLDRKHNILLQAKTGVGYECLTPERRIDFATGKYTSGLKMTDTAATIAEKTDRKRLTPESKRTQEFLQISCSKFRLVAVTEAKRIAYPDPVCNPKLPSCREATA